MRRILVFVLVLVLVAVNVFAGGYEVKKKAGVYNVLVIIDKNPPVVGKNGITIGIEDASGKNVTDAKVVVRYSMPAMPGMAAMNYKTDTELKGSEYKAVMDLSMAGSWNVEVKILKAAKTSSMKFSFDVH